MSGGEPWSTEPDRLEWTDKATGLRCVIRRQVHHGLGHLCGYVALAPGHPLHGQNGDGLGVDVHGGITWSGTLRDEPAGLWWFGFDCAHFGDLVPGMLRHGIGRGDVYRDLAYVQAECARLAAYLAGGRGDCPE